MLEAIQAHAHTDNPGNGRIFVIPIEETVKIRTGERWSASGSYGRPDTAENAQSQS